MIDHGKACAAQKSNGDEPGTSAQLTPYFGPGGDKHGRNVAVLFFEQVSNESAQQVANYGALR